MIHDLMLKTTDNKLIGYVKLDVSNDTFDIDQKSVNVLDISFLMPEDEEQQSLQEKVERNILPTNYLFKDLSDKFSSINVLIEMEGVEIEQNITTTTTTEQEQ